MAEAASSSASLLGLPSCVLSSICNELQPAEQGALRRVCSGLSCTVDSVLQSVSCSADIQQLSLLLSKLKGLKQLMVEGIGSSGTHSCYAGLHYHAPDLIASLSAMTALTTVTLTCAAAAQLGALKWAAMESENAVAGSIGGADGNDSSSQQEPSPLPSALDDFFWVPDWLASAPRLQQLVIQAPDAPLWSRRGSRQPVWLWLHAPAWADKLTCLQFKGVPLPFSVALPAIEGLTCLQRLVLTGTQFNRAAVKRLLWQLASCRQLTALDLSANDLSCLPEQGWEWVASLRDLDVSRQKSMLELPAGLSHLSALTALRVHHNALTTLCKELSSLSSLQHLSASHNWLSGGGACLPRLIEAWPHLTGLELDNVSDKRGRLLLPHQLAACKHLVEVSIRDNFHLDWASVMGVLPSCKALRVVRLDKDTPSAKVKELQAVLAADWVVSLE